ncbi:MAG: MliC family protein [Smithellaceae bacterium]
MQLIKITNYNVLLLGILFILVCISGCCILKKDSLTVRGGENVTYQCENGDRIVARYYSLSDDSLNFVKIILPAGKEQTLSQALSASGVRYTDDRELVWWIKGDSARMETRDRDGNWQLKHKDCKVVPDKK